MGLEFSSPKDALEINPTENGYTYMGIYQGAHPEWLGWKIVREYVNKYSTRKEASIALYNNEELRKYVFELYKTEYWNPLRLDEIIEQRKADEMFVFGVNAGITKAVKLAQKLVGVKVDGRIGKVTIGAINAFDVDKFDVGYDVEENKYYDKILEANPAKKIFAAGWRNRAKAV